MTLSRRQVEANVVRDPSRLLKPTAGWIERQADQSSQPTGPVLHMPHRYHAALQSFLITISCAAECNIHRVWKVFIVDAAVFVLLLLFLHVCCFQSRTDVETRPALTPFTAFTQTVASVPLVRMFVIVTVYFYLEFRNKIE